MLAQDDCHFLIQLFDRSTMKDMAPLSECQADQDLAIEEYKYP